MIFHVCHPLESLGAISIHTVNDKSPGVRNITKTMALNIYRDRCKDGTLGRFP